MDFSGGQIRNQMGLDVSGYRTGMMQATSLARLFPQVVNDFIANPLLGVASVAKSAAAAVGNAFSEIAQMTRDVGRALDDAGEAAQNAGVQVKAFTSIKLAASDSGVDDIADSFKFLNRNAADAFDAIRAGKPNATSLAFASLGIQLTDVSGKLKSTEQLFYETADAISAIPDPAKRTQAAMDVLGRGGGGILAFLSGGSAGIKQQMDLFDRLGASVTQTEADAGDSFARLETIAGAAIAGIRKSLVTPILLKIQSNEREIVRGIELASTTVRRLIHDAWAAIGQTLAVPVPVSLMGSLQQLHDWVQANPDKIQQKIREAINQVKAIFDSAAAVIGKVIDYAKILASVIGGALFVGAVSRAGSMVKGLAMEFVGLAASINAATAAAIKNAGSPVGGRGGVGGKLGGRFQTGLLAGAVANEFLGFNAAESSAIGASMMTGNPFVVGGTVIGASIHSKSRKNEAARQVGVNQFAESGSMLVEFAAAQAKANETVAKVREMIAGAGVKNTARPAMQQFAEAEKQAAAAAGTLARLRNSRTGTFQDRASAAEALRKALDDMKNAAAAVDFQGSVIKEQIDAAATAEMEEARKAAEGAEYQARQAEVAHAQAVAAAQKAIGDAMKDVRKSLEELNMNDFEKMIHAFKSLPEVNADQVKQYTAEVKKLQETMLGKQLDDLAMANMSPKDQLLERFRKEFKDMDPIQLKVALDKVAALFELGEMKKEAKEFRESLKSPMQKYEDMITKLDKWKSADLITAKQYAEGVRRARAELEKSTNPTEVHGAFDLSTPSQAAIPGSLFKPGSGREASFAMMYGSGGQDYQKQAVDELKEVNEQLKKGGPLVYRRRLG